MISALVPFLFILGQWGMGPGPGLGAFTHVPPTLSLIQSNSGYNFSSVGVAVAYPSSITANNFLVAAGWDNTGFSCNSSEIVTDTKGNTWSQAVCQGVANSIAIWYCLSANSSGADTVTFGGGSGNWYSLHIMEFPGPSLGLDVTGNHTNAAATVSASGPVTGTDLVIAFAANGGTAETYSTPTGYTAVQFVNGSFGITSQSWFASAYQTSGTPTATTTPSGGSFAYMGIAAFKM